MHSDAGEKQISTVGYKIQATIQRGWTHLQVLQEKWRSLRHGINAIYSFFIMTLVSGGRWLEPTGVFSIIPGDNKKKGQYVIFRLSYVEVKQDNNWRRERQVNGKVPLGTENKGKPHTQIIKTVFKLYYLWRNILRLRFSLLRRFSRETQTWIQLFIMTLTRSLKLATFASFLRTGMYKYR